MQYTGKTLLQNETIGSIQKETQGLLANKDVAGAYSASQHIKRELSALPKEDVAPILPAYRRITAGLKALALPVLSEDDVSHLLANNLEFLDTQSEPLLIQGLAAWLASQPDERVSELKKKLGAGIDMDSPFAPKLSAMLADKPHSVPAAPQAFVPRDDGMLAQNEREDLSRSAQKARAVSVPAATDADIDSISRNLFSLSGSRDSEEAFARRGRALVASRLRDIRTAALFADYAARPFAAGGLGLSGDALIRAERIVEEAYNRSHGIAIPVEHKPVPARAAVPAQNIAASPETPEKAPTKAIAPSRPRLPLPARPLPAPRVQQPQAAPRAAAMVRRVSVSTKPRMHDVMPAPSRPAVFAPHPSAMGLADALGTITIADFRAFGPSPDQASQAILGKIATLGGDSISQKLAGIAALRNSPLFSAYLAIGDSALSGGKKLLGAISDPAINPDVMTEDEFFAIADLASKLK